MTLRVAIVGCGKAAENHVAEIKKLPNVSLVAACDSELLMAEQFGLRHGVQAHYSDLQTMLNEQSPDVVHIATPPQSHVRLALMAIDAGCHLFLEKPLAETSEQAAEIIHRAECTGRKLTVGWTYYFDPTLRAVRELIAKGSLGAPVHLDAFLAYDLHGMFGAAVIDEPTHWVHDLKGKLVQNNLDHLLSLLVDFFADDSAALNVFAWRATDSPYPDLVDELRFLLRGENTSAHVTFSCRARPVGHFLTIAGTRGTVHLDVTNQLLTRDCSSTLPGPFGRLAVGAANLRQLASQNLKNFARFARSDFHPLPGLEFLVRSFYHSIECNEEVPIPYAHIMRVSAWMDQVVNQLHQPRPVPQ
jgi:predicted dehydrogenase